MEQGTFNMNQSLKTFWGPKKKKILKLSSKRKGKINSLGFSLFQISNTKPFYQNSCLNLAFGFFLFWKNKVSTELELLKQNLDINLFFFFLKQPNRLSVCLWKALVSLWKAACEYVVNVIFLLFFFRPWDVIIKAANVPSDIS